MCVYLFMFTSIRPSSPPASNSHTDPSHVTTLPASTSVLHPSHPNPSLQGGPTNN